MPAVLEREKVQMPAPPAGEQIIQRLEAIGFEIRRMRPGDEYQAGCIFGRGHGSFPVRLVVYGHRGIGRGSIWILSLPGVGDQHILNFFSLEHLAAKTKNFKTLRRLKEDLRSAYGRLT